MATLPPAPDRDEPPRLPKSYTVGHERDASPQVGRAVLVLLAVVCLGLQGVDLLFQPSLNLARLLASVSRVGFSWASIIALTAGLGWARWPLALFHVGLGIWLETHAMMGTFAYAYPGITAGSSVVPALLGALFLGAGGWFGLSADLSAYLDRERTGALTFASRLTTAAILAVVLGVPAAGLVFSTVWVVNRAEPQLAAANPDPIPVPPQSREGGEFARALIERALAAKDFGVFTAAMSPEMKAQTKPEWTQQVSRSLARRGPPQALELTDVFFNLSVDHRREMTYCNVFAVYPEAKLCFHCNLSRAVGAKDWEVDTVFIE